MIVAGIRRDSLRFAFSALQETMRALHVLSDARHHAEQMAWVRSTRRRLTPSLKSELKRFSPLLCPLPELFAELLPSREDAAFAGELALLERSGSAFRSMMVRRIAGKPLFDRAQLRLASRAPKLRRLVDEALSRDPSARPLFEAFLQSPEAVRRDLCSFLDAFFVRCLAPRWQEFDSRVREDAAARRRLIDRFGMTGMFRTLTRRFSVSGTRSSAQIDYDVPGGRPMRLELPGDAIVALTPSYFIWPHATLVVLKREKIDVRITYPLASPSTVRPRAPHWDEAARRLSAVADPTRLRMLDLLHERDLSTREFAGLLGLSEGGVSRHLAILREAKLVTSIRDGYFVLYRRSADGLAELATLLSGF